MQNNNRLIEQCQKTTENTQLPVNVTFKGIPEPN